MWFIVFHFIVCLIYSLYLIGCFIKFYDWYKNSCTKQAKQIWESCYNSPWPKELKVYWVNGLDKECITQMKEGRIIRGRFWVKTKVIELNRMMTIDGYNEVFRTLIHEFTHFRHPDLKHSSQFELFVEGAYQTLLTGKDNQIT